MARILDESFEGAGYEESWSERTDGGTVNEDSTGPGSLPGSGGSQCLLIHCTGSSVVGSGRNFTSGQAILYARAYIYVGAENIAAGGSIDHVFGFRQSGQDWCMAMGLKLIKTAGGQLQFQPNFHSGGSWINMTAANISTGTWYCVEMRHDATNQIASWRLNGEQISSSSGLSLDRGPIRGIFLGSPYGAWNSGNDIYFDLVAADDASWVGPESGSSPSSSPSASPSSSPSSSPSEGTPSNSPSESPSSSPSSSSSASLSPGTCKAKAVFIHHSTGGNLIADTTGSDGNGGLALEMDQAGYFFSDICYGWDAPSNADIGNSTDIGHWHAWFADTTDQGGIPRRDRIMGAVYAEYDKDAYSIANYGDYTRQLTDPGGENEIVVIKSCYPNADIYDDNSTVPADFYGQAYNATSGGNPVQTVSNVKALYNQLLNYMKNHTDKMFVIMVNPPLSSGNTTSARAANMRSIANWLVNDWLSEGNWTGRNVFVWDFFNILTDVDNHHYVSGGVEVHHTEVDSGNYTVYAGGDGGGDHPTGTANRKATSEFIPLLDLWYDDWQGFLASISPSDSPSSSTGIVDCHPRQIFEVPHRTRMFESMPR